MKTTHFLILVFLFRLETAFLIALALTQVTGKKKGEMSKLDLIFQSLDNGYCL
uniref:Uncharacterized protein n=1 Tax=Daphnia magna TaxID=35525 RepID=A0A0N8E7V4_9CRUS